MILHFIRHGMTAGNQRRAYIGSTDEPLCEAGEAAVREKAKTAPPCSRLIVSPMLRSRQTASILYPQMPQEILEDFRECDFGVFEGRTAEEMTGDAAFQGWIDADGMREFPGGEDPAAFKERCCAAFEMLMQEITQARESAASAQAAGGHDSILQSADGSGSIRPAAAGSDDAGGAVSLVVHGGVIMALFERYALPRRVFYEWHVENAGGYTARWDGAQLTLLRELS